MPNKINIFILFGLFALSFSTIAGPRLCKKYCYAPCKTRLSGRLQIKNMSLNDPEKKFTAYVLVLSAKIAVPENESFDGVAGEDHVQLDFFRWGKNFKEGDCINVVGELTGPITASDNYNLIMQVDSVQACKIKHNRSVVGSVAQRRRFHRRLDRSHVLALSCYMPRPILIV